ncbi:hypothetical protein QN399_01070 [Pseudomonas sp. 10C3]|uniref:hypothetical protein n=1 Tax=Pseudomonas sp. 10C3 TaxID=3118753 RepID=UPI002E81617C|nr:hypothetical protein [Pseudomonas sp. 10C3]MEE3504867.1 hypothetical protein [Pseudomonas sp. 10C3]
MTEKKYFVKDPAEAAIPIVAALITAGFIPYDADEIAQAHKIISRALDKPKTDPMKISQPLLSRA